MTNVSKSDFEDALHDAIRAGDVVRRNTLRIILTAHKHAEVEKNGELDQQEILAILQKQAKMRRESIAEAEKANRADLIPALQEELSFLGTYLPQQISEEDLKSLVRAAIDETSALGIEEMGKVMKVIMPRVQGRAEGKAVSGMVKSMLSKV